MTSDQRDIIRNLRILRHAQSNGSVVKTCRYVGIGRASFYRWKTAYESKGDSVPYGKSHDRKAMETPQSVS